MAKRIVDTCQGSDIFLKVADEDYLATRLLFMCGSVLHNLSAYHSQQCLEKYIKAYTIQKAQQYVITHNLDSLRESASNYSDYFSKDEIKKQLAKFNVYDQVTRYGSEALNDPFYDKNESREVSGFWVFGTEHIKILDKLVYEIRGLLDFDKIKWPDTLKAILEDKKDHIVIATWKSPIPIKKILTTNNNYYK